MTADDLIRLLDLRPHPVEGGFFAETYRSAECGYGNTDPRREGVTRSLSTAIYYLLAPGSFSAMHRLPADEIFHFYLGDPVEMLQLEPGGTGRILTLGQALDSGQRPQVLVSRGVWQGSRLMPGGRFALLGTTMAPGFDLADYEPGVRRELAAAYPDFREWIIALTR